MLDFEYGRWYNDFLQGRWFLRVFLPRRKEMRSAVEFGNFLRKSVTNG